MIIIHKFIIYSVNSAIIDYNMSNISIVLHKKSKNELMDVTLLYPRDISLFLDYLN